MLSLLDFCNVTVATSGIFTRRASVAPVGYGNGTTIALRDC